MRRRQRHPALVMPTQGQKLRTAQVLKSTEVTFLYFIYYTLLSVFLIFLYLCCTINNLLLTLLHLPPHSSPEDHYHTYINIIHENSFEYYTIWLFVYQNETPNMAIPKKKVHPTRIHVINEPFIALISASFTHSLNLNSQNTTCIIFFFYTVTCSFPSLPHQMP